MEFILVECNKGRPMAFKGATERAAQNKLAKWINDILDESEQVDDSKSAASMKIDLKLPERQFEKALDNAMECLGWEFIFFDTL